MSTQITHTLWGTFNEENIYLFKLQNNSGAYAEITNYGAAVVSVVVPDNDGRQGNVVIGFPQAEAYLEDNCYIGSTIGRFANRISNARFTLNGEEYHLGTNDGINSNHGATCGFNYRVFGFELHNDHLVLVLHSNDGDGGFPGNLNLRVTYKWTDDNELHIHYAAVSDKDTIANFTNHAYFNLSGADTVFNHQLSISAAKMVDAGDDYIPTGKISELSNNAFTNTRIGDRITEVNGWSTGVNSFYVLDDSLVNQNGYAAKLSDEASGRTLEVSTSYPGVFLYTGDYLSSTYPNHYNRPCRPFEGLCLECQHYPDSINRPEFPQAVLKKHVVYNEYINYKFGLI